MHRTRVGYCGGETPDPTYRKVCASGNKDSLHPGEAAATPNGYAQYAETIQLEFDEAQLSYADVLDAFFRAHDAERRGKSRQYQSVIFVHSAEQQRAALEALNVRPKVHTKLRLTYNSFVDWPSNPEVRTIPSLHPLRPRVAALSPPVKCCLDIRLAGLLRRGHGRLPRVRHPL